VSGSRDHVAGAAGQAPSTSPAASFRENRRILELYAEAIAGRRVELRTTDDLPDLSAHIRRDLPTSSARCVFLPATVEDFATTRENFAVYKIAILHQLGFWECGTYSFALDESRGPAEVTSDDDEGASDLARFFDSFERPALARQVFTVLEDTRVDAHLLRRYRGMRHAFAALLDASIAQRPLLDDTSGDRARLEALVQLSLTATKVLGGPITAPSPAPPALAADLAVLRRAIDAVRERAATVYTTASQVADCLALFGPASRDESRGAPFHPTRRQATAGTKPPEPIAMRRGSKSVPSAEGDDSAASVEPVPFRGAPRPELVQKELRLAELERHLGEVPATGAPLPSEVLRQMLERGEIEIESSERRALDESSGLSAADLPGLADRARESARQRLTTAIRALSNELEDELGDLAPRHGVHYYDEWDHEHARYRRAWCRLTETRLDEETTAELDLARREQAELFSEVKRQFELLRPDARRVLKRLADGEDIDLDAAVEARADRIAGTTPSEQVYMRRDRREREVAAAFLLDMSASTDSEVQDESQRAAQRPARPPARDYDYVGIYDDDPFWGPLRSGKPPRRRRVIDVEKEALLLMAEALDALGDAYGVYGFSGYGREQVEFYVAKDFAESCDQRARERIAGIRPKRSTRMGPAIRHATRKLRAQEARVRVLLVLSDGYPQDFDYGRDRTSRAYGIQDTMMALREAELQGIHTFCLTVDPAGHDYLREMCPERQYLVIDDVASLPRELPKVYRGLTT
jgi:nitric oxide reductase activation protein